MRAEKEKFSTGFGNKFEKIYHKVGKKAETEKMKVQDNQRIIIRGPNI